MELYIVLNFRRENNFYPDFQKFNFTVLFRDQASCFTILTGTFCFLNHMIIAKPLSRGARERRELICLPILDIDKVSMIYKFT